MQVMASKLYVTQLSFKLVVLSLSFSSSKFVRFFAVAPYGEQWRHERKLVSFAFSKSMVPNYYPLQEAEARKLVQSLLENPEDLFAEVKL